MDVHGQLLSGQFENLASDPTPASTGRVYFNTTTLFPKVYNSVAWKTLVDSDSVQTITNKYTPVVTGSASASGTLTLVSTDNATKGYITVNNGSAFLFDQSSASSSFAGLMAGHFNATNTAVIFANSAFTTGNMTLAADSAGTCFIPCFNSRGTFAAPTSLLNGDGVYQISCRSFATASAQDFIAGQKNVGVIAMFASENHSTTNLGTIWSMTAVPNGTATRKTLWKSDGTMQFILGDPTISTGRNFIWAFDGSGNIGTATNFRPDRIFAKTDVNTPSVKYLNPANTFSAEIKAPALLASYSLTLPLDDGTTGQVLSTDGSGVLSWATHNTTAFPTDWTNGDGATKSVVHNLGSTDLVAATIVDLATNQVISVTSITVTNANQIDFVAGGAPATTWRVVVTLVV